MDTKFEFDFYFNEVDIVRDETPKKIIDFEMVSSRIMKLKIDCVNKDVKESGITIKRRKKDFKKELKWEIKNPGDEKICLSFFIIDKKGYIQDNIVLDVKPRSTLILDIDTISKDTEKLLLLCKQNWNKNIIGTLTVKSIL